MIRHFCTRSVILKSINAQNAFLFPMQKNLSCIGSCFKHAIIARSVSTSFKCFTASRDLNLVSRVEKEVKPYGYLELQNLDLDLVIRPASPDAFPNMDRATCSFFSKTENTSPEFAYFDGMLTLRSHKSYKTTEHECCMEVPIKYEVDVANLFGENSVHVESLETVSVRVATCSGNISTKNLKGNYICLLSQSGKINCKRSSQGRIVLQSGNGDIEGQKFQGPSLKVTTNSGNIHAQSIYSDSSHFSSVSGDIILKNLHMKSYVKISGSGSLTVSGMDGSLHAQLGPGSHEIQISQLKQDSYVQVVNGTLVLKVPDPCSFGIRINAQSLDVSERMLPIGSLGKDPEGSKRFEYRSNTNDPIIEIDARKSKVQLINEDWFSSLKLGFGSG